MQISFNAEIFPETLVGHSNFIPGATDLYLIPDIDLLGCGLGNPAYTSFKFTDKTYTAFNPGATQPSCDSASRDTSLNTGVLFIKQ